MGGSRATVEFVSATAEDTAGTLLESRFCVPRHALELPVGVARTDQWFDLLEWLADRATPEAHAAERERLIEAFLDAHRAVADKRAIVCGEEDLVVGLVSLLAEMGIAPVLCASAGTSGRLRRAIDDAEPEMAPRIAVLEGRDFEEVEELAARLRPDVSSAAARRTPCRGPWACRWCGPGWTSTRTPSRKGSSISAMPARGGCSSG